MFQSREDFITRLLCLSMNVLKKWQLILFVVVICGVGLDSYHILTYSPTYTSSLTASISAKENTFENLGKLQNYIPTLQYLLNSKTAKTYCLNKMHKDDLNLNTTVSINTGNIVTISVHSKTKEETYFALDYIVEWYNKYKTDYQFPYTLSVIEKNIFSETPSNVLNHTYSLIRGGFLGGVFICAILLVLAYLRQTIQTPKDVKTYLKTRLFATIPKENKRRGLLFFKPNKKAILISSLKTSFNYKESINKLRSRVEESANEHHYKTFMITSTLENEGKSSIAANLAIALAKNDHKVLLIDGDIRKPSLQKIFNIKTHRSLNNFIFNNESLDEQILHISKHKIHILLAQKDINHAETILSSEKFYKLLQAVSTVYDYVIIDSSPSYELSEPFIINEYMDASLFVVKQDVASRNMINETLTKLSKVNDNIIGIIYNSSVRQFVSRTKSYGYRYGYYGRRRHDG